ncbi:MAG: kinase-like domain-containing protein [Piptocephalis tieghemiana]|nr:MAG: kinase-like domain-containing protein [Piptocephalis tieghemiana]
MGKSIRLNDTYTVRIIDHIASGGFGSVYRARDTLTGRDYALKHIRTQQQSGTEILDPIQEAKLHQKCSGHPNIVEAMAFLDGSSSSSSSYLLMEMCEEGDLFDAISAGTLPVVTRRRLFLEVCAAVSHCHAQGVAHRDLKPENVMLVRGPEDGLLHAKLGDFGLATSCESLRDNHGSPRYLAPEALGLFVHDPKPADVWSLGILLAAIVCGMAVWELAEPADPAFHWYMQRPETGLKEILGVNSQVGAILRATLRLRSEKRLSVTSLADRVHSCACWGQGEVESEEEEVVILSESSHKIPDMALKQTDNTNEEEEEEEEEVKEMAVVEGVKVEKDIEKSSTILCKDQAKNRIAFLSKTKHLSLGSLLHRKMDGKVSSSSSSSSSRRSRLDSVDSGLGEEMLLSPSDRMIPAV